MRELSEHALRRMAERGISEGRVWAVVDQGRWAARRVIEGIDTEVIFVVAGDVSTSEERTVVITCYDERSERWQPVMT